jgi:zinc transporter ZupT
MLLIIAGASAFVSTFSGGLFALRFHKYLKRILGFTAGVVLGVVAFDILPEIFDILQDNNASSTAPMVALVCGFLAFHLAEKLVSSHHASEEHAESHTNPKVGLISALALVGHSFLDGVGIGLAFQVNSEIGLAVTLAVLAHDFSDGLNTVSLMLAHGNERRRTTLVLLAGAAAPILGALSTMLFHLTELQLTLYLGFFCGFLLYIAAGSILPEAHRHHFSFGTFLLTVLGAACMFAVTRFTI